MGRLYGGGAGPKVVGHRGATWGGDGSSTLRHSLQCRGVDRLGPTRRGRDHRHLRSTCAATWLVHISPGVTSEPGEHTISTRGQTGTVVCEGLVDGQPVSGPGTVGELGAVRGSCVTGTGSAVYSFVLPTPSGPRAVNGKADFVYGPAGGVRHGDEVPGTFEIVVTQGDCISSPITQVRVFSQILMRV